MPVGLVSHPEAYHFGRIQQALLTYLRTHLKRQSMQEIGGQSER
ncbi:hypothetical protein [Ktedonosporobacter rubrisoli]|nr:hypothetical protein [Ktedonosporobacter rubrisoli]